MSWSETSTGSWERPMGENEQFIKLIGDAAHMRGREQWSVTAISTFNVSGLAESTNLVDLFIAAWKKLRFQHPGIASTATDIRTLRYTVPDQGELDSWVEETFFAVQDPSSDVEELVANLKPSPTTTLHLLPHTGQVILHTAHWRTDGYGALQLLDALFAGLAEVYEKRDIEFSWGEEFARLPPSLESALDLRSEGPQNIDGAARRYLATAATIPGTVGVPYMGDGTTLPGRTRFVYRQLSRTATTDLQVRFDGHGLSIYSAVHAALATLNFAKSTAGDAPRHYASTIRHSLRQYLVAPYNTEAAAAGLYTGGYTVVVEPGKPLIEHAKRYESEYRNGVTQEFLHSRQSYAALALEILRSRPPPPLSVSNIDVSFVRGAESLVRPEHDTEAGMVVKIESIGLGVETLTRQPYCFFWVFGGQLHLYLWFNEAYHSAETATKLLKDLEGILVSETQVQPST